MRIRKSTISRFGWVILLILLIAGVAGGITLADSELGTNGFTFHTSPINEDLEFYLETNGNGLHDPEEFVGIFDVYDGNNAIVFSWTPYAFPADVNGSYRISLWQNTNPLGDPVWVEHKVSHHWADQPTTFSMGSFGFGEEICTTCPSIIGVVPEVYTLVETDSGYEYEYTTLTAEHYGHWNGESSIVSSSPEILIQIFRPAPAEDACTPPWLKACRQGCVEFQICEPGDGQCIDFCVENICPYGDEIDLSDETCGCPYTASSGEVYCQNIDSGLSFDGNTCTCFNSNQ